MLKKVLEEIREGISNQSGYIAQTAALLAEIDRKMTAVADSDVLQRATRVPVQPTPVAPIKDAARVPVAPIQEIEWLRVNLSTVCSAVATIIASEQYATCVKFFAENPATERALMSPHSQALLYTLVRNLRPQHVFEVGTYRAGSSETICRALDRNECGMLHTADPFGAQVVPPILASWPVALQERVRFYPINSMAFYSHMVECKIRPELVFVDGNHDYEFASFDIESAARLIPPGGLMVVDNISQAGPYFAVRDFLARNPAWQENGPCLGAFRLGSAFDANRTTIINTDSALLRAPDSLLLTERPITSGQLEHKVPELRGIRLEVASEASGTLHTQGVLRVFADTITETIGEGSIELSNTAGEVIVPFREPLLPHVVGSVQRVTAEPWVSWSGKEPLRVHGNLSVY